MANWEQAPINGVEQDCSKKDGDEPGVETDDQGAELFEGGAHSLILSYAKFLRRWAR
jgi:hypothetical protein